VIAVDTSALMAIIFDEKPADACIAALESESNILISAGTVAEAFVVATRRGVAAEVEVLIGRLGFEIVNVTKTTAVAAGNAYQKWGKGIHPAALNFGDCFAYALAKEYSCPLLYIGNDFSRTDIRSVL
jgi:ribonuclease VapC